MSAPTVHLEEHGIVGYCIPTGRIFDCYRPAIATVLQIPLDQMPDPHIDARIEVSPGRESRARISREVGAVLDEWLRKRGLTMTLHDTPPDLARWIAVVSPRPEHDCDGIAFTDHCIVMSRNRVIFDPAIAIEPPPGERLRTWTRKDFRYGISFFNPRSDR